MIYTISTSQYVNWGWDAPNINLSKLQRGCTYITTLNVRNDSFPSSTLNQKRILKQLEDSKDIQILYKSPLAVNLNPGHGTHPRNVVVVFYYPALCELAAANAPVVQTEDKTVAETTF